MTKHPQKTVSGNGTDCVQEYIVDAAVVPAQPKLEGLDTKGEPDPKSQHSSPPIERVPPDAHQEAERDEEEGVGDRCDDGRHEVAGSVRVLGPEIAEGQKVDPSPAQSACRPQRDDQDAKDGKRDQPIQ